MNIQDLYKIYLLHPNISTDTRACLTNSLFFCLKGDSFDGNKFALQALELGAAYVVADDHSIVNPKVIIVGDVLKTLQELAHYHRQHLKIPVIGITGTNGKTTTKELVNAVLKPKFKVACTQGNLNNHIGVPLTLLSIRNDHEMAVVEMGANHVGEIADLCAIAHPDFGIITNIGKAHLEGFGGVDGIIKTKKALYDSVIEVQGVLFVNSDDKLLMELAAGATVVQYGTSVGEITGTIEKSEPTITVKVLPQNETIETQLVGDYNLPNILCAIAVADYFKVDFLSIKQALHDYTPQNNRSQLIKTAHNEVFMDAYNANPSSMEVAISHFLSMDKPNKVAIIGGMKELGEYSPLEHQKIIDRFIQNPHVDAFFVGPEFAALNIDNSIKIFKSAVEAIDYFKNYPILNAYILLKGSRGIKMETILPVL